MSGMALPTYAFGWNELAMFRCSRLACSSTCTGKHCIYLEEFVILAPETAEKEAIEIAVGVLTACRDRQLSVGVNSFPPIRNSLKRQKSCTKVALNPPHKHLWAHGKSMTPMWCHWVNDTRGSAPKPLSGEATG